MKESLTISALATELERQRSAKVDYLVPADRIHFVTGQRTEIDLLGTRDEASPAVAMGLSVNDYCHGQFASRLNIPKRFYDRLRDEIPDLLDANVNRLLRHGDRQPWMIRTLDGTARAALSDQYRRIDNLDIAEAVLPILRDIPGVVIRSSALTDSYMYLKATTPRLTGQVKVGQDVCAGVYIRNSEVGAGKFVVAPFVETLQCTNGMVVMRRGTGMMEQIHLGSRQEANELGQILSSETRALRDRAFMATVSDVVHAAVDEVRFRELIADMSRAAESDQIRDVAAAVEVLTEREGLTEHEGSGILQHLAAGGDLSQWGLLSAVTRAAEDSESYDRASELEALGGKILDYNSRDWRALAFATN
jgi:hypothetical protein